MQTRSTSVKCTAPCAVAQQCKIQQIRRNHMRQPFRSLHSRSACGSQQVVQASCTNSSNSVEQRQELQLDRRALLLALVAAPGLAQLQPAYAEAPSLTSYKDKSDEFSLSVPSNWVAGEGAAAGGKGYTGASGVRRALAWYPEGDLDTNLTIVITNVGADFTRLGSFGDAEQFGGTLVAQMDRSYLNRSWNKPKTPVQSELWPQLPSRVQLMTLGTPGCSPSLCISYANHAAQEAKLLDAKAKNNMYFIEYTVKKPSQEQKHLLSAVALGFNGRYNRLYTVTGQCKESELSQYKGTLQTVLQSFAPPSLPPY
ncbi:TPA: hypothetical protein ACH3X2_000177 [Trebouxia sp. C0005]